MLLLRPPLRPPIRCGTNRAFLTCEGSVTRVCVVGWGGGSAALQTEASLSEPFPTLAFMSERRQWEGEGRRRSAKNVHQAAFWSPKADPSHWDWVENEGCGPETLLMDVPPVVPRLWAVLSDGARGRVPNFICPFQTNIQTYSREPV